MRMRLVKELGIFLTISSEKQALSHQLCPKWASLTYFVALWHIMMIWEIRIFITLHDVS